MSTAFARTAAIICALDVHINIVLVREDDMGRHEVAALTRDLPREGRRVTTQFGSEWFIDADAMERMGFNGLLVEGVRVV